ncbi:MAG: mechanosensitive ion channel, partial [Acidobacteriales bacterium]|nr:mechanosensitive ion channel [Terriglobales bacterium]
MAAKNDSVTLPAATGSGIVQYLNQTIQWYRELAVQQQLVSEPAEELTVDDNRQLADQALRLAFDYARAAATLVASAQSATPNGNSGQDSGHYQTLLQISSRLDKQIESTQQELEQVRQNLASANRKNRPLLQATVAELQSELDLMNARREALKAVEDFVTGTNVPAGTGGLRAQIEVLARSLPAAASKPGTTSDQGAVAPAASKTTTTTRAKPSPGGIWGLASDLFALSSKQRTLRGIKDRSDQLVKLSTSVRTPLINRLKELSAQGDQIALQADNADAPALAQQKVQLDSLTDQFKAISAAVLPLGKQEILLNLYQANLEQWQQALSTRYRAELLSLGERLAFMLLILVAILGLAELWRRTIFRYIRDSRRRYQLLLLRKIVLWAAIAGVAVFTLSSQLGSIATFAGLLTAGVAVALQSVILSIVGYFFLIGRYGITVGDRVQVSGTSGEVIEVGLVRFYMVEYAAEGVGGPTGRVASFSNSIVFQPTAGLFKQIPGTNFSWHEVSVALP